MTAAIIPFPGSIAPARQHGARPLMPTLPVPFTSAWQDEHLPLIDAATDLARTGAVEFARRCQSIADADGVTMLERIADQLDRIAEHLADVVATLATTAERIRMFLGGSALHPA